MKPGFFISLFVHASAVFGGMVLFSGKIKPMAEGRVIPVEMITVAELTNIRAAVKAKKPEDIAVPKVPMALETPMENAPEDAPKEEERAENIPEQSEEPAKEAVIEVPDAMAETVDKPEDMAPTAPAFDLDKLDDLVNKARETQPEAHQQKTLVAEANRYEFAVSAREGAGEQNDLTLSERDALQSKMYHCWRKSSDAVNPEELVVQIQVKLSADGEVQDAKLMDRAGIYASGNPYLKTAAERALRAVSKCAPYDFLPPEKYSTWKDMTLTFRPDA